VNASKIPARAIPPSSKTKPLINARNFFLRIRINLIVAFIILP
jgi:hypothetical protein